MKCSQATRNRGYKQVDLALQVRLPPNPFTGIYHERSFTYPRERTDVCLPPVHPPPSTRGCYIRSQAREGGVEKVLNYVHHFDPSNQENKEIDTDEKDKERNR